MKVLRMKLRTKMPAGVTAPAFTAAALMASAMASSALAQTVAEAQICVRGGDQRAIEVLLPGNVGKACDLRYTRDGGANVKTPYHANSSQDFCSQKAAELVRSLRAAGFDCAAANAVQIADAPPPVGESVRSPAASRPVEISREAPGPTTDPVVAAPPDVDEPNVDEPDVDESAAGREEAALAPNAQTTIAQTAPQASISTQVEPVLLQAPEPRIAPTPPRTEIAAQDQLAVPPVIEDIAAADTAAEDIAAAERQAQIPSGEAVSSEAVRGPLTLTRATAPTPVGVRARSSAAGRLVGAEPDPNPPRPTRQAAANAVEIRTAAPVAQRASQPASQTVASEPANQAALRQGSMKQASLETSSPAKTVRKMRPAPDIIRGVLNAQAAAWNDGDLDGFMAGYWKSPDLRFVSGTDVTTGWSQTMKKYKKRYGEGASLGILTFEDLDVEMVSDDVAVVVGEFNLTRNEAEEIGKFSLVLKQFDGRWRIVHDHTVTATQ